ncbi:MAG: DUF4857 domain-containing protein [Marinifilaceae bacterium]
MKIINYLIIILATFLLAWILPSLYHMATDEASGSIFSYYSSVEKSFCTIDFDDKESKLIRKNVKTNREYTENEFDSILPMFYYRQLLSDGRMPDSIHGMPVSAKQISRETFYFRHNPSDKNKPHIPLYTLFESFSGRVDLEMPGDVFRITDRIEFIAPETNTVNIEKSERFTRALTQRGFQFPAKVVAGNPTTRKSYDEGYFVVDRNDKLYHLKMVNGKPFVKNIKLPNNFKTRYIATMEPSDRSFYAFMFDDANKMYMISTDNYQLVEIPSPKFDVDKDRIMIMANPLYWIVNVISASGKESYALDAKSKNMVDSFVVKNEPRRSNLLSLLIPFSLKFESSNSKFVESVIHIGSCYGLFFNLLFVILFLGINRYRNRRVEIISSLWIACTGIFGFIPCLILNK